MRIRQSSITVFSVLINEFLLVQSLFVSLQSIHHQTHQRIYNHHHIHQRLHHRHTVTPITYSRNSNKRNSSLHLSSHGSEDVDITRSSSGIFTQSAEDVYSILVELAQQPAVSGDEDCTVTRTVDLLLGIEDIKRGWVELDELIVDGELLSSELDYFYKKTQESSSSDERSIGLDKEGFFVLYQSIDDLFEPGDEGDDSDDTLYNDSKETDASIVAPVPQEEQPQPIDTAPTIPSSMVLKEKLLSILAEVHTNNDIAQTLACVFDCKDEEREVIHYLIGLLETNGPSDLVLNKRGKIDESSLMGEWDLRYTSSHAMLINRSLSGLGRSTSKKAQFQGLRKRLGGTKYLGKAEYIETFGGEEASFDVVVMGEWFLEEKKRAPPRRPLSILRVNPESVTYGPITNNANEWSSLSPIKLLDILYLDEGLMILRGNVNLKSFFIYQRVKE